MDIKTSEIMGMIRNDIRRVELSLRGEIEQIRDDLCRHIDVVVETLREDIRSTVEDLLVDGAKAARCRTSADQRGSEVLRTQPSDAGAESSTIDGGHP
jgi:hypothetical protein